jgi:hypothetical protein
MGWVCDTREAQHIKTGTGRCLRRAFAAGGLRITGVENFAHVNQLTGGFQKCPHPGSLSAVASCVF